MHTVMPVSQSEGALFPREWCGDTHRQGCLAQRSTLSASVRPRHTNWFSFACIQGVSVNATVFGALQTIVKVIGLQLFKNSMNQKPLMSLIKVKIFLILSWT